MPEYAHRNNCASSCMIVEFKALTQERSPFPEKLYRGAASVVARDRVEQSKTMVPAGSDPNH